MNATVGDIAGNARRIRAGIDEARAAGAQLVLFGELALTGYPPEDLLLREHFLDDARTALEQLAGETEGIVAVVGFPERQAREVYNAAAVLADNVVRSIYRKVHLPNYGVFDEQRYFKAGHTGAVTDVAGHSVGLTICEDLWRPGAPAAEEARAGAKLILNISASPYHAGKGLERERLFAQRAREHSAYVAFCGLVGGQDELVFDGHSFVLDPTGETVARAAQFEEELLVCDLDLGFASVERPAQPSPAPAGASSAGEAHRRLRTPIAPLEAEVYAALCLGLHDYVQKNGFRHVILGLSGGIDSALVGCIAADALGAERVSAAIMPSPYSSADTQGDARALAAALGVRTHELPIEAAMDAYAATLRAEFSGRAADLTEENLQARIRGNLLMALSNKFGWLVLTTGNKSEMSVGYTTLYGDLAGGFAVIKDVPKTLVYSLCEWRNSPGAGWAPGAEDGTSAGASAPVAGGAGEGRTRAGRPAGGPIPRSIIDRAPSAELREGQRDEDSLPPYALLDRILHGYIELDRSREQLIAEGLPEADVDRTIRLVDLAEYKRRQAPPGIKITTRAFGRDRRMPITNGYRCPPVT
ncbi:MAG: NAD+ synthase [Solirubrobacterales bacterium]